MTQRTYGSDAYTYSYAGTTQNELISQVPPGGNTIAYTWGRTDGNGMPLLESLTTANGTAYLTHDQTGAPMAMRSYTGTVTYYAHDGLGSPVALITPTGVVSATYAYDPYGTVNIGNPTNSSAATLNPYRFTGGIYDRTTGYLKLGQRFYSPDTGRFTQQDSLETLADPSRANRYEYAAGNPINYVDPTGRDFWDGVNNFVDAAVDRLAKATTKGLVVGSVAAVSTCVVGAIATGGLSCVGASAAFVGGFVGGPIEGVITGD